MGRFILGFKCLLEEICHACIPCHLLFCGCRSLLPGYHFLQRKFPYRRNQGVCIWLCSASLLDVSCCLICSSSCLLFISFNSNVVNLSGAANLSSCAAAAFSKASCFFIKFSTSSIEWPNSSDFRYGSCAISQASATAASLANW